MPRSISPRRFRRKVQRRGYCITSVTRLADARGGRAIVYDDTSDPHRSRSASADKKLFYSAASNVGDTTTTLPQQTPKPKMKSRGPSCHNGWCADSPPRHSGRRGPRRRRRRLHGLRKALQRLRVPLRHGGRRDGRGRRRHRRHPREEAWRRGAAAGADAADAGAVQGAEDAARRRRGHALRERRERCGVRLGVQRRGDRRRQVARTLRRGGRRRRRRRGETRLHRRRRRLAAPAGRNSAPSAAAASLAAALRRGGVQALVDRREEPGDARRAVGDAVRSRASRGSPSPSLSDAAASSKPSTPRARRAGARARHVRRPRGRAGRAAARARAAEAPALALAPVLVAAAPPLPEERRRRMVLSFRTRKARPSLGR